MRVVPVPDCCWGWAGAVTSIEPKSLLRRYVMALSDLIIRYALVIVEGLETNPVSDLDVVAVPKPPVVHNPFLRMNELPGMLQKLRARGCRSRRRSLTTRRLTQVVRRE